MFGGGHKRVATAAAVLCVLLLAGCVHTRLPIVGITVPFPKNPLMQGMQTLGYEEGDFQTLGWSAAFEQMHAKLSREYPFTEWKAVDWESLHDTFAVRIADAEAREDGRAFYTALRQYTHSIPDGYIFISNDDGYRDAAVGGGVGLQVVPLDGNMVVAYGVTPGGEADRAGIQWGAQILEWNGKPVRDALKAAPAYWNDTPSATWVGRMLDQSKYLPRAADGEQVTVTFLNPKAAAPLKATLTARSDGYQGVEEVVTYARDFSELESPFEVKRRPDGTAVVTIFSQSTTLMTPFPDRAFTKAVEALNRDKTPGVVLDLRGNTGGDMELAAKFAGHFLAEPRLLGEMVAYDPKKGGFALDRDGRILVEPQQPRYEGRVVVLVHRTTRDTGQVIAAALQGLPNVRVVGVLGTEGSLAKVGGKVKMPGGHVIHYPVGRIVDGEGRVLISANAELEGGVMPDVTIPANIELLDAQFHQGRDPLMDAALAVLAESTKQ